LTKVEKIIHGDALDVLKTMEDNSVDSVVTDPPYGLSKEPDINEVLSKWLAGEEYDHGHGGFMGKSWDSFVPHPDIWREVYRVLKPGGHALVFAGTRTQDLMTISLRLAGFEVRDVIEWLYFSGFPKSHDVSKAFDRRKGGASFVHDFSKIIKEKRLQKGLSLSYMDGEVCGGSTNYSWFEGRPAGVRLPQLDEYYKIKEILELDDTYDELMQEAEREKIGEYKGAVKGGVTYSADFGNGEIGEASTVDITAPATELAHKWDGWGTALKPSHEPIIVVRKPLIDADTGRKLSVADCVEKYGTGAINIDASRIGDEERTYSPKGIRSGSGNYVGDTYKPDNPEILVKGRFPANCITLDSDEFYSKYFNVASAQEAQPNVTPAELSKKASKKDRNSDWRGEEIALEPKFTQTMGDGIGKREHNPSQKGAYNGNNHPTVKPTNLMAWLVRLVTPEGGTILDPFAGSGSTLVAAKREGFGFIGVELTEEYIPIIEARTGTKAYTSEGQAKE